MRKKRNVRCDLTSRFTGEVQEHIKNGLKFRNVQILFLIMPNWNRIGNSAAQRLLPVLNQRVGWVTKEKIN